jgi:Xaa-Pro aminopeptidase
MSTDRAAECATRAEHVAAFLLQQDLDAVVLRRRGTIGWLLGGVSLHVRSDTEDAIATVVVTRDHGIHVVTDRIECDRLRDEELASLPVDLHVAAWTSKAPDAVAACLAAVGCRGTHVATETPFGRWPTLDGDAAAAFRSLREVLHGTELVRYRALCRDTAVDLEAATTSITPGVTEHDVAAELSGRLLRRGVHPAVVLVAFDERIDAYRHPIPTDRTLRRRAMVVVCAESGGLVAAATRFATLRPTSPELQRRFAAVADVDAAAFLASRPGAHAGDVYAAMRDAYRRHGFPDEIERHHQGGAIGYACREWVALPGGVEPIRDGQAFAWNPSITGTKSEDTILVTASGHEILTATGDWPTVATPAGPRPIERVVG